MHTNIVVYYIYNFNLNICNNVYIYTNIHVIKWRQTPGDRETSISNAQDELPVNRGLMALQLDFTIAQLCPGDVSFHAYRSDLRVWSMCICISFYNSNIHLSFISLILWCSFVSIYTCPWGCHASVFHSALLLSCFMLSFSIQKKL